MASPQNIHGFITKHQTSLCCVHYLPFKLSPCRFSETCLFFIQKDGNPPNKKLLKNYAASVTGKTEKHV